MPGEPNRPLYHPCKCSGTIKYVHRDCLENWLQQNQRRACEICKHKYTFKAIYRENAPNNLPFHLVAISFLKGVVKDALWLVKAVFCLSLWILVVPKIIVI